VKQVGRELTVRYVLEGGARKAGNWIRVAAQLIEGETGNHFWPERYDRDLADMFAVQDDITDAVTIADGAHYPCAGSVVAGISGSSDARSRNQHRGRSHGQSRKLTVLCPVPGGVPNRTVSR